MAITAGKDTVIAIKPTSTWHTAATLGAGGQLFCQSLDPAAQKGNVVADEGAGKARKQDYDLMEDVADPTIVDQLRWNSAHWCFLANWMGDDTKTGVSAPFTHTFNYQPDPTLVGITIGWRINTFIHEVPSVKVQALAFEAADGFWNMTVTTLGDTVLTGANATNTDTEFNAVTAPALNNRMRFKANQYRQNAQGGAALGTGDVIGDVFDFAINLSRPYDDMKDVLKGAATGAERRRAEPIQGVGDVFPSMIVSYSRKTADLSTHLDDLNSGNEYKGDLKMSETISAVAHSLTWEFGRMVPVDPQYAIERGLRIPMLHSFELFKPSSTPTGFSTSNEIHVILANNSNVSYETLT